MSVEENLEMGGYTRPAAEIPPAWSGCTPSSPG